ncbi:MAG: hypothetical protein HOV79_20290 [Hamadaea sp.]|nr:hypothetical protein [Hamadaea sp.]
MSITTIKVDSELRDRLAAIAAKSGRTLGQQIAYLLDLVEHADRWKAEARIIERFKATNPEAYEAMIPPAIPFGDVR